MKGFKKVLVLSPLLADKPSDGDRVRLYHWLRVLSQSCEITLASFYMDGQENTGDLEAFCRGGIHALPMPRSRQWRNVMLGFFGAQPSNVQAYQSQAMHDLVKQLKTQTHFDAVLAYRIRMAPYAIQSQIRPLLVDFTDSLAMYFSRRAQKSNWIKKKLWQREAAKIERYETALSRQADAVFINGSADALYLKERGAADFVVAANGVAEEFFKAPKEKKNPGHISFVGNLAYPPNAQGLLWFCRNVLPLIQREIPDIHLNVIGDGGGEAIRDLKTNSVITLFGRVENLAEEVTKSVLSVCPIHLAAGRQNKMAEAMALGVPVVSTPLCAQSLEVISGKHCLTGHTEAEFAAACLRLLRDEKLAKILSSAAKTFVKKRYRWESSAAVIKKALGKKI